MGFNNMTLTFVTDSAHYSRGHEDEPLIESNQSEAGTHVHAHVTVGRAVCVRKYFIMIHSYGCC